LSGVVASLYANFYANTGPLQNGLKNASNLLNKFTGGVGGAAMALTGVNSGLQLAEKAFKLTAGQVIKAIDFTIKYASEVHDLSQTIGATYQQSSRLIEATDDVGISFSTLQTSMGMAIKKGYAPTIQGIKDIAAAYTQLNDPLSKTKMLYDVFGRGGISMQPLIEMGPGGIAKLEATVNPMQVLNAEQVAFARHLEIGKEDLKDFGESAMLWIGTKALREYSFRQ
jgi:uncharacterized phage infection (PIP) family protein YhgE